MAEPSGSNFPASADDSTSLLAAVTNQKSYVVSGAHSSSIATITTTATISGVTAPGYLVCGRTGEIIHFAGISGTQFTTCTRGADGTTNAAMVDGDVLYHSNVAKYHNQLRAAVLAIETALAYLNDGVATDAALADSVSLEIQGTTTPGINAITTTSTAANRSVFKGTRARGTADSPTVPSSGDAVVSLLGSVYDGSTTQGTLNVQGTVDGTVSAGVAPQRLDIMTSSTTGAARTTKLSIGSDGKIVQETNCIRKLISKTGIPDNSATNLFTITTVNESGSNDGGVYSVKLHGVVAHGSGSAASKVSCKSFGAQFCRAIDSAGVGANSAVTENLETASAAPDAATKDVGTVTLTLVETSEYVNTAQILVDVTGSSPSTADVTFLVELVYIGFLTPPVIAVA